ncbi:MAG TPA: PD-(D/E)XK nuclease family protein [Patescibacteria group bacterium]
MPPDKFAATWVSHSSMRDFLSCPRAYYLNNVYRDPNTKHKIQLMSPALALGGAVHEVVESLSVLPAPDRLKESLISKFDKVWKKVTGEKGGFSNDSQEQQYKQRGEAMLRRIMNNPGPITRLAVKIKEELPQFWLSESDNIILCGKIDWLEYLPDSDSVHIIDFKTSKREEAGESLQLPIYHLLVSRTQRHKVSGASYWYLELSDELQEKELPDLHAAEEQVLQIAKKIKLARQLGKFACPEGENGCRTCRPLEKIVRGQAKQIGVNSYNQDVYILTGADDAPLEEQSVIL